VFVIPGLGITDAELRALVLDCLAVWDVKGRVRASGDGIKIGVATVPPSGERKALAGTADEALGNPSEWFALRRAAPDQHPTRWFLHMPGQSAPSAVPSIVSALNALKNAIVKLSAHAPPNDVPARF
jgi:hypothetical protein